jgi:TatD DNase family protein
MIIFDSHAHYNDDRFGSDAERDATIKAIMDGGVKYIINAGTNPDSSRESLKIAEGFEGFYASVGIHPSDLYDLSDPYAALSEIEALASHHKAVAIGEIGLDYHWHEERHDFQKEFLHYQLDLAEKLSLPVIIHDREAHGDCLDAVFAHPNVRGVFHSYSGSAESAKELIKRGWYISFSGVVTFKNAARLAEIVPTIPDDRILVETDCPYLTPHPHRGERNDSSYLTYTIDKIASLRGTTPERIASLTLKNTAKLFSKCGITTEE